MVAPTETLATMCNSGESLRALILRLGKDMPSASKLAPGLTLLLFGCLGQQQQLSVDPSADADLKEPHPAQTGTWGIAQDLAQATNPATSVDGSTGSADLSAAPGDMASVVTADMTAVPDLARPDLEAPTSGTPALIQAIPGLTYPGNTLALTLNNVGAGNAVIVVVRMSNAGTSTVTGSGLTWTRVSHITNPVGDNLDIHIAISPSGGTVGATITDTTPADSRAIYGEAIEFSGLSGEVVTSASREGYLGLISSGPVTISANRVLLFSAVGTDGDNDDTAHAWAWESGWSPIGPYNDGQETWQKLHPEYLIANAGTYTGSFMVSSDSWMCSTVAFALSP